MAKSDTKRSRGRGGWGGGYYNTYDDEGRGASKAEYDAFVAQWETTGFDCKYLLNPERFSDDKLYRLWKFSTWRYEKHDWKDRVRNLITKKCSEQVWQKFSGERLEKAKEHNKDQDWMMGIAYGIRDIARTKEQEADEAIRIQRAEDETIALRKHVELTAGLLHSDFHQALTYKEKLGQNEGDWLDDPVSAYVGYGGFGEEVRESVGIKLQITVSLDISNSMINNNVAGSALEIFKVVYLSMKELETEFKGDVFTAAFLFSGREDGRWAKQLTEDGYFGFHYGDFFDKSSEFYLGEIERFRYARMYDVFDGEDTWIYPLFEEIEKWENRNSDPGAVRLDLVISDATLEHPKDLRESDVIQERRDGALQTVILNLMPEEEWHGSALPRRCIQYPANTENLAGMLRNLISEFVSVYI